MTGFSDRWLVIIIAGLVTYLTTLAACRLAMYADILPDNPNGRSSHSQVTSRAGGVGIFGGWFAGVFILASFSGGTASSFIAVKFAGIAFLAFLIGLADDKWALSPLFKFSGQAAVATLFTWLIGPLMLAPAPFLGEAPLGMWGVIVTVIWIVGFMNAFNFMDGANGIAAGSALTGLIAFSVIALFSGAAATAVLAILLAIACFGFLPANLARGRLFMGDSGSQAISFLIAGFGVYAANASDGRVSALIVPVIFLPFIFDVCWTLAHRVVRGQNILAGHREHNYQLLLRLGFTHAKVAIIYMSLTAFSAGAAILMLALSPEAQWLAPVLISAVFIVAAAHIYSSAAKAGILSEKPGATENAAPVQDIQRAAE